MKLGEQISAIREKLKQAALTEAQSVKESEIDFQQEDADKVVKKLQRGYAKRFQVKSADVERISYDIPPLDRRKGCRRAALTVKEKLEITHQVIVEKRKWSDVAKEF